MTVHIPPSKVTAEQIEIIREMRLEGVAAHLIGAALGLREDVVKLMCSRHAIPFNPVKANHGAGKDDLNPHDIRRATIEHLKDILREHGYGKVWANYSIPPETAKPMRAYYSSSLSVCGSPATMCEEAAG